MMAASVVGMGIAGKSLEPSLAVSSSPRSSSLHDSHVATRSSLSPTNTTTVSTNRPSEVLITDDELSDGGTGPNDKLSSLSSSAGKQLAVSSSQGRAASQVVTLSDSHEDATNIALSQLKELDIAIKVRKVTKVDGRKTRWIEHRRKIQARNSNIKQELDSEEEIPRRKSIRSKKSKNSAWSVDINENASLSKSDIKYEELPQDLPVGDSGKVTDKKNLTSVINNNTISNNNNSVTVESNMKVETAGVPNSFGTNNVLETMKQQFLQGTINAPDSTSNGIKEKHKVKKKHKSINGSSTANSENLKKRRARRPVRDRAKCTTEAVVKAEKSEPESLTMPCQPSNNISLASEVTRKLEGISRSATDFFPRRNYLTKGLREVRKSESGSESGASSPDKISCSTNISPSTPLPVSPGSPITPLITDSNHSGSKKCPLIIAAAKMLSAGNKKVKTPASLLSRKKNIIKKLSKKENLNKSSKPNGHSNSANQPKKRLSVDNHVVTGAELEKNVSGIKKRGRGRPRLKDKCSVLNWVKKTTVIADVHNTMNGEPQTVIPANNPVVQRKKKSPLQKTSMNDLTNSMEDNIISDCKDNLESSKLSNKIHASESSVPNILLSTTSSTYSSLSSSTQTPQTAVNAESASQANHSSQESTSASTKVKVESVSQQEESLTSSTKVQAKNTLNSAKVDSSIHVSSSVKDKAKSVPVAADLSEIVNADNSSSDKNRVNVNNTNIAVTSVNSHNGRSSSSSSSNSAQIGLVGNKVTGKLSPKFGNKRLQGLKKSTGTIIVSTAEAVSQQTLPDKRQKPVPDASTANKFSIPKISSDNSFNLEPAGTKVTAIPSAELKTTRHLESTSSNSVALSDGKKDDNIQKNTAGRTSAILSNNSEPRISGNSKGSIGTASPKTVVGKGGKKTPEKFLKNKSLNAVIEKLHSPVSKKESVAASVVTLSQCSQQNITQNEPPVANVLFNQSAEGPNVKTVSQSDEHTLNTKVRTELQKKIPLNSQVKADSEIDNNPVKNKALINSAVSKEPIQDKALINSAVSKEPMKNKALITSAVSKEPMKNKALINSAVSKEPMKDRALINSAVSKETMKNKALINSAVSKEPMKNKALINSAVSKEPMKNKALINSAVSKEPMKNKALINSAVSKEPMKNKALINSAVSKEPMKDKANAESSVDKELVKNVAKTDVSGNKELIYNRSKTESAGEITKNTIQASSGNEIKSIEEQTAQKISKSHSIELQNLITCEVKVTKSQMSANVASSTDKIIGLSGKPKEKVPRFLKQLFQDEGVQNMLRSVHEEISTGVDGSPSTDGSSHKLRPKRVNESLASDSPEPDDNLYLPNSKRKRRGTEVDNLFLDEGALNMLTSIDSGSRRGQATDDAESDSSQSSSSKIVKVSGVVDEPSVLIEPARKRKLSGPTSITSTQASKVIQPPEPKKFKGEESKLEEVKQTETPSSADNQRQVPAPPQNISVEKRKPGRPCLPVALKQKAKLQQQIQLKKQLQRLGIAYENLSIAQMKDQLIKAKTSETQIGRSVPPLKIKITNVANVRNDRSDKRGSESKAQEPQAVKQNSGISVNTEALQKPNKIFKTLDPSQRKATSSPAPPEGIRIFSTNRSPADRPFPQNPTLKRVSSNSLPSSAQPLTSLVRSSASLIQKPKVKPTQEGIRHSQRASVRQNDQNYHFRDISLRKFNNFMQIILTPSTTKMRNSLNSRVLRELCEVLSMLKRDDSIRMVLFTSIGSTFCQGIDLTSLQHSNQDTRKKNAENLARAIKDFLRALVQFPKMIVAGVNGSAMGLGVTMLPLFDLVFATEKAEFFLPYAKLGQVPEGGATYTFPYYYGKLQSNKLFLGQKISANQAQQMGLVSEAIWPATFQQELIPKVALLAAQSPQSMEGTKALVNHHILTKLELSVESECRLLLQHWTSQTFFHLCKRFVETADIQLQKPVNLPL